MRKLGVRSAIVNILWAIQCVCSESTLPGVPDLSSDTLAPGFSVGKISSPDNAESKISTYGPKQRVDGFIHCFNRENEKTVVELRTTENNYDHQKAGVCLCFLVRVKS